MMAFAAQCADGERCAWFGISRAAVFSGVSESEVIFLPSSPSLDMWFVGYRNIVLVIIITWFLKYMVRNVNLSISQKGSAEAFWRKMMNCFFVYLHLLYPWISYSCNLNSTWPNHLISKLDCCPFSRNSNQKNLTKK